jgi:GT2 family glycosyltransferase
VGKRAGRKGSLSAGTALRSSFYRLGDQTFAGFVADPDDLGRKFVVELWVDGQANKITRADAYVHELAHEQFGDGCYGFSFTLGDDMMADSVAVEARLANVGTTVGAPIWVRSAGPLSPEPSGSGRVRWLGGLRFGGWIRAQRDDIVVNAFIEGELVAEAPASGWFHIGENREDAIAVRAFDLHLPERFADGRVHRVQITDQSGLDLPGSPCAFVAFADGLKTALDRIGSLESERLRAEYFDQLFPISIPFSMYERWRSRFPVVAAPSDAIAVAVILVGKGDVDGSLDSLNSQSHPEWFAASLPERSNPVEFDPRHARQFLESEATSCELVVFGLSGTRFASTALQRFISAFSAFPQAAAAYGDVEIIAADGKVWPIAWPAFDYERMLEQGYCSVLFAMRRQAAERALELEAADLYRLFNVTLDQRANEPGIVHIPGALGTLPPIEVGPASHALAAASSAHLRARSVAASVRPSYGVLFPAVHVSRTPARGLTSIIIPIRNRFELLRSCIESITPAVTGQNVEIIIVDNDSSDPETLDYLSELRAGGAKIVNVPGAFNFARLHNIAVTSAAGEYLCLLNNDIEALDETWLTELLGRMAEPDVGAVGAMLLWPSGVVQHGGVVLGPSFAATHAFNDRIESDPGYGDQLCVAHECSAVTAACLLMRRSDYLAVGGMDELRFAVNFNDVDLCLKLRALGKRIVFTPHAQLVHLESASRGADDRPDRAARMQRELQLLRARWAEAIMEDPYYNPTLSLDPVPYSALAWPPRRMDPRIGTRPIAVEIPAGL